MTPAEACRRRVVDGLDHDLVTMDFSIRGDSSLRLEQFWSERERRKGHGTRAMQLLLDSADETGVELTLCPYRLLYDLDATAEENVDLNAELNELAMEDAALEAWYARFGFVRTGAFEGDHPVMRRLPGPRPAPPFG